MEIAGSRRKDYNPLKQGSLLYTGLEGEQLLRKGGKEENIKVKAHPTIARSNIEDWNGLAFYLTERADLVRKLRRRESGRVALQFEATFGVSYQFEEVSFLGDGGLSKLQAFDSAPLHCWSSDAFDGSGIWGVGLERIKVMSQPGKNSLALDGSSERGGRKRSE